MSFGDAFRDNTGMICAYRLLPIGLALSLTGLSCFRTPMGNQQPGTTNTSGGAGRKDTTVTSGGSTATTRGTAGGNTTVAVGGIGGTTGSDGAIGGGSTSTKRVATTITAGESHTCALLKEGTIQCWGNNVNGLLGIGTTDNTATVSVTVSGITDATTVTACEYHTCATLAHDALQCWGSNEDGDLGNGVNSGLSAVPVTVAGVTNAIAVTGGLSHTCALLTDGTIQCWGDDEYGQLGDGTTAHGSVLAPVAVLGISDATGIAAGTFHTCAVLKGGEVQCWGHNEWGALGNGTTTTSAVPVTVSGMSNAVSVSAGDGYSCALLKDGTVNCWGGGLALGSGTMADSTVPVAVSGITNAINLAAGDFHACAALSSGSVKCWGSNDEGELGIGSTSSSAALIPVTVLGMTNATAVTAGCFHTCALLVDGVVQCWGWNLEGQLGSDSKADSYVPTTVSGF